MLELGCVLLEVVIPTDHGLKLEEECLRREDSLRAQRLAILPARVPVQAGLLYANLIYRESA